MLNWIIALCIIMALVGLWLYRFMFPAIIKKKAQAKLQKVIFPRGKEQKDEVMELFHEFTQNRFTNEQILDYFIKIKGLQNLSVGNKTNFWVKKYLLSPTDVKLNYFEQVKFYEIFLNYNADKNRSTNLNKSEIELTQPAEKTVADKYYSKSAVKY